MIHTYCTVHLDQCIWIWNRILARRTL